MNFIRKITSKEYAEKLIHYVHILFLESIIDEDEHLRLIKKIKDESINSK